MATLGTAYINIAPNLSGVQSKIASSFKGLGGDAGNAASKGISGKSAAIAGAIGGATAAVVGKAIQMITSSIGDAVSRVDTLNNAPKVLQNLGYSAADSKTSIDKLAGGIKGLPTALDSAASSLTRIASSTGYSIDKATDLTLAFNNMGLAGGKGAGEVDRAMVQFTQAMGRGQMGAQEFNTLMEVMPAQMNQVAKAILGADANAQDLKQAFTDGKVSTDQFADAIMKLNAEGGEGFASFETQAKDATQGIGTGFENMRTAITRGVAEIITAIGGDSVTGAISAIGEGFEFALHWAAEGFKILKEMIAELITWLQPMIDYITQNQKVMELLKGTLIFVAAVLGGAILAAIVIVVAAVAALTAIIDGLIRAFTWVMQTAINVWNGIRNVWNGAVGFFRGIADGIANAFNGMRDLGKNIVKGLWNGISDMVGWITGKIKGFSESVLGGIKSFFGIKSPSRVMQNQVGKMLIAGLGLGMEDEEATLLNQARGISSNLLGAMNTSATFTGGLNSGVARGAGEINQTNNVYTELDMNVVNRNLMWEFNRT